MFTSSAAFLKGEGHCFLHDRVCCVCPSQPDISSGGYTCRPFSTQRYKGGDTPSTGPTHAHPACAADLGDFSRYLDKRRPHTWWMEQGRQFAKPLKALGGRSPLQFVGQVGVKRGYAVRAIAANHSTWVAM